MTDRRRLDLRAARARPALEMVERGGWLLRTARTADGPPGVFATGVLPERRRQGLGARVLGALGDWAAGLGAGLGADRAYLQVEAGNAADRGLHAGLQEQYAYHYRRTP